MNRNGFLEIPFSWLFAIIIGSIIIFLAIFAVTKISQTQEIAIDAQTSKQIGILLNPLETSFETAKTTSMILPSETRIFNRCNNNGYFGRQIIKVSQKSFGKWTETDVGVGFSNKYIFSEEFVEGKKFYLFSKPFNLPFKVADVIYLTSSEKMYCFGGAPDEIEDELENLNQTNIFTEISDCPDDSIRVCFSGDCDIKVNTGLGYVEKRGEKMYFDDDSLMFAAIFSDPFVYECQLKRLMQRGSQLSQLYIEKANFISREECFSNADSQLLLLASLENNFGSSVNLNSLTGIAKDVQSINKVADCKLW